MSSIVVIIINDIILKDNLINCIMKSPLKNITAKQVLEFLPTYKGTLLTSFPKLPLFFTAKEEGENMSLRREMIYQDFKEAFSHLNMIATSCNHLGYSASIFNVYNKVIVECYSVNESGNRCITTKDLFMAYLLNEL